MQLSIILVDGSFRDNLFSAEYFSKQTFPETDYEILWVEFYKNANIRLNNFPKVEVVVLGNDRGTPYHSSYCFNEGIRRARGEILVIADADQVIPPDLLERIYARHSETDRLVTYVYRYDEREKGSIRELSIDELESKCVLKNLDNHGAFMAVRKKWLLRINGYEQHEIFGSGFHANGKDIYTRLKNYGLAIEWDRNLKIYHPWHENTLRGAPQYNSQQKVIQWRANHLRYEALRGIDPDLDYETKLNGNARMLIDRETANLRQPNREKKSIFGYLLDPYSWPMFMKKIVRRLIY